jgi:hypothetical protein
MYNNGFYYWLKNVYKEMQDDLSELGDSARLLFILLLSLKLHQFTTGSVFEIRTDIEY